MSQRFFKLVRIFSVFGVIAFVSMAIAGQSGASGGSSCPDPRASYTPKSDVQFIDFFQPHHMMAIEMANEVVERGESSELKTMAQEMKKMQTEEIKTLRAARKALTGKSNSPHFMDHHMMMDMKHMKTLSGVQLDVHFIDHMIAHHASALPAAHQGLPYLKRIELKEMARMIVQAQAREIGELQKLRD